MCETAGQKALDAFLTSTVANGYGYQGRINTIRQEQYPQIKDAIYLDHAGATLPAQNHIQRFTADLAQNLYANPHSRSSSSQATTARVYSARRQILEHFQASTNGEWDVIFTANATAAIRLVGETFPWTRTSEQDKAPSKLWIFRETHTSVVGLRGLAQDESKAIQVTNLDRATVETLLNQSQHKQEQSVPAQPTTKTSSQQHPSYNLFAYPAQCNYSGRRFPLNWPSKIRQQFSSETEKTLVLLDAASYSMTSQVSLSDLDEAPDFMVVSFYKMFGFPTGLGALIVKTEHKDMLHKHYFGGGTITMMTWDAPWQAHHDTLHGRLEEGTLNFLDIIALDHAFASMNELYGSHANISPHVSSLQRLLYNGLRELKHWNNTSLCTIYVEHAPEDGEDSSLVGNPAEYGPIVNFNLKQSNGKWIGYAHVERLARMQNIHLRVGGFCNPGSMQRWLEYTADDVKHMFELGHVCSGDTDILNDKPTGSIRVSIGAMSTAQDVLRLLDFLSEHFVEASEPSEVADSVDAKEQQTNDPLDNVDSPTIHPIRSCKGQKIPTNTVWPLDQGGLKHDQEWVLVDQTTGAALTQKQFPRMGLLHAEVLLDKNLLVVEHDDIASILGTPPPSPHPSPVIESGHRAVSSTLTTIANISDSGFDSTSIKEDSRKRLVIPLDGFDASPPRVFGSSTKLISHKDSSVNDWFSAFLDHPCCLVRQPSSPKHDDDSSLMSSQLTEKSRSASTHAPITFTIESSFVMITDESEDEHIDD
ncbi:hypothetical protein BGZ73_005901 [Actinomortierella ambigua]|nr:hypothetical protein BGZ73_005901 [Actinomortierella ambigua]